MSKKVGPLEFIRQVRQETGRITWPTRKETTITTIMVFIMVFVMVLFFLGVDRVLSFVVKYILGLGV